MQQSLFCQLSTAGCLLIVNIHIDTVTTPIRNLPLPYSVYIGYT